MTAAVRADRKPSPLWFPRRMCAGLPPLNPGPPAADIVPAAGGQGSGQMPPAVGGQFLPSSLFIWVISAFWALMMPAASVFARS